MMHRRAFLARTSAICAAGGLVKGSPAQSTPVAKTSYGELRGARADGVLVFKGIPYAGSPAGENRFRRAPRLKPWTGVRDALAYGAQSMQPADPAWPKEWKAAVSNEDCLFLNVWTQGLNDGKQRPVMFYSHGGGFATGNGGADVTPQNEFHDGAALARDYDVVVVTHNHRLGIFGYLYLGDLLGEEFAASGIAGMLDIVDALTWVRDNIEHFGGDPGNVMIWGESGGGAKTSALTAMPPAQGLYHRASIESGAALRMKSRAAASETTRAALSALNIPEKRSRELLTLAPELLVEVMGKLPRPSGAQTLPSISDGISAGLGFSPMVDGKYLPANPYDPVAPAMSARIPLIVGTNKDETLFMFRAPALLSMNETTLQQLLTAGLHDRAARVLEVYRRTRPGATPAELYIAITTAQWMRTDAITLAERKAALNAGPVFMYEFAYGSPSPAPAGVPYRSESGHAGEIAFKFDHVAGDPASSPRARAAKNMSGAWASFARSGNPSHSGIPEWPAYTVDKRATMILDADCKVMNDPRREERLVWRDLE